MLGFWKRLTYFYLSVCQCFMFMNTRNETTRGAEMESRPRARSNGVNTGQVSRWTGFEGAPGASDSELGRGSQQGSRAVMWVQGGDSASLCVQRLSTTLCFHMIHETSSGFFFLCRQPVGFFWQSCRT